MQPSCLSAFIALGNYLRQINSEEDDYLELFDFLERAEQTNGWFTKENCLKALKDWGNALEKEKLERWFSDYALKQNEQKQIGLILAGNIPLVGLHDLLCVLAAGHRAEIKLSSSDPLLLPFLYQQLQRFDSRLKNQIVFTKERLTNFDAVIATGSNNAARYFKHYFDHVPHIIRKNRNGLAVLSGEETKEELDGLAQDILSYFGLGCRNIARILLPKSYDLNLIFGALYPYAEVMNHAKYANNYDYNKAVFLMSEYAMLDNGFFLLLENNSFSSPVGCLHYSFYDNLKQIEEMIIQEHEKIQCVSSQLPLPNAIALGKAQQPELWDYADGRDTLDFLLKL